MPDSQLYRGNRIDLPVDSLQLVIKDYYPNAALVTLPNCRRRIIRICRLARWPSR